MVYLVSFPLRLYRIAAAVRRVHQTVPCLLGINIYLAKSHGRGAVSPVWAILSGQKNILKDDDMLATFIVDIWSLLSSRTYGRKRTTKHSKAEIISDTPRCQPHRPNLLFQSSLLNSPTAFLKHCGELPSTNWHQK